MGSPLNFRWFEGIFLNNYLAFKGQKNHCVLLNVLNFLFFQSPMNCVYMPNDTVPLIVGLVLAVVVLFVILAYLYGRRRHRQSSYDQV